MQKTLIDTVVLYGALNRRDEHHGAALSIFEKMDNGNLPVGVVLDLVYAETFNALTRSLSHEDCLEAAEVLERSAGFRVERINRDVWRASHGVYEENAHLSFVDSVLVAYARESNVEYIYSFDTGFDSVEGVNRLKTAVNPYSPSG
ncbi:MAG: PIN domain-containing protein [Halobacteriales archaeon]|nr:PIN domain-containing protein [Halobacteriales archaeon]